MARKERLDKYLSHIGYATRGTMRRFFQENSISINGTEVTDPSMKIDPETDRLTINDEVLPHQKEYEYFILNKPKNVISTTEDELGRETVVDLIETNKKLFPVGRLDKDTTGLVLLTNDGELTHKLIHPKYHVPKTYLLTITGDVTEKQLKFFQEGVMLKEGKTAPAKAKIIKKDETQTFVEAILFEGWFQQIRRMCYALHLELAELQRTAFGPILLGKLPEGSSRSLTEKELTSLKEAVVHSTHQNQSTRSPKQLK